MPGVLTGPEVTVGGPPRSSSKSTAVVLRVFVASVGLLWIIAGGIALVRFGARIPENSGILFRPTVRFSDLADPLAGVATGAPFSGFINAAGIAYPYGINYPPGSVPILSALLPLGADMGNLALVLCFGLSLGILMRFVALRVRPLIGTATAVVTILATVAGFLLLDLYPVVLVVAGAALLAFVTASGTRSIKKSTPALVGPICALSFPSVIAIDRMNIDLAIVALAAVGLALIHNRHSSGGSLLLGAAIGAKIFPYAFIVAYDRAPAAEWVRRLLALVAGSLLITAGGFALIRQSPFEAIRGLLRAFEWAEDVYAVGDAGMGYGASLFTGLKAFWIQTGHPHDAPLIASVYHYWAVAWLPVTLAVIIIVVLMRIPVWSRLAITTSVVLLASPISGGYRVTFELIPLVFWAAFLIESRVTRSSSAFRWHVATAIAFALVLSPKTFWTIAPPDVTSETLLTPIAIMALTIAATGAGLHERAHDARATHSSAREL